MKIIGYLLAIGGFLAFVYTGINYLNNSESFSAFGLDIAVSSGNPMPVILSIVAAIAGMIILKSTKNN